MRVRNHDALVSNGNVNGRRIVLNIIEAGLEAADPHTNTRKMLRVEGNELTVGCEQFDVSGKGAEVLDLAETRDIYVVGAGKADQRITKAIEGQASNCSFQIRRMSSMGSTVSFSIFTTGRP